MKIKERGRGGECEKNTSRSTSVPKSIVDHQHEKSHLGKVRWGQSSDWPVQVQESLREGENLFPYLSEREGEEGEIKHRQKKFGARCQMRGWFGYREINSPNFRRVPRSYEIKKGMKVIATGKYRKKGGS